MIINNRFEVDTSRCEVLDKMTGKTIRLEPRLMKVLCLFIENRGQLVRREFIIRQVWNDYPGAGEGLNQAISFLRKLLEDDQKKIIETLPKSGYCFHGTIGETRIEEADIEESVVDVTRIEGARVEKTYIDGTRPGHRTKSFRTAYVLAGICIVIAFLFLVRYYQSTEASVSKHFSEKEAREISKIDSARQAERLKENKVSQ